MRDSGTANVLKWIGIFFDHYHIMIIIWQLIREMILLVAVWCVCVSVLPRARISFSVFVHRAKEGEKTQRERERVVKCMQKMT